MALPPFGWRDRPSTNTPISSAELEAFGLHVANYFDGGQSPAVPIVGTDGALGGPAGTPLTSTVLFGATVSVGNLGSALTVDFQNKANDLVTRSGTLNADCTVTFINRTAGCRCVLLVVQDNTGSHALNVSDGNTSQPVAVTSNAAAATTMQIDCPNATDIYISLFS